MSELDLITNEPLTPDAFFVQVRVVDIYSRMDVY